MINRQKWYKYTADAIYKKLNSSITGLSEEEAKSRIIEYGRNKLPSAKRITLTQIIIDQLTNPLIYILIIAALLSLILGDIKDSFFIFLVILINTVIGAYQEWKAEKSSEALQNLMKICTKVKRDKEAKELNAVDLVPGDIVLLESGDKVPADIRIINNNNLTVDESLLTGESIDIGKTNKTIESDNVPLAERDNMLHAGSVITSGRATGIVVLTGANTEIGEIAKAVASVEKTKTPLLMRMEKFSHQVSIVVLLASILIAAIEIAKGSSIIEVFFIAVALAVSAIPEGLPASLTVALSVGMSRMSNKNVIIRRLPAVEGLGSCTHIASDKTGTLTVNKQTAKLIYLPDGTKYTVTGEGYNGDGDIIPSETNKRNSNVEQLVISSVISNEGSLKNKDSKWVYHGDAVDISLLALSYKHGINPYKLYDEIEVIKEIPYESERKFSAKFYRENSENHVAVKGAFEIVLGLCKDMSYNNHFVPIDKDTIEAQINDLSKSGHRVIAIASGKLNDKDCYDEKDLHSLTFLGLVGLIDPLRPEAKAAVEKCHCAGIKVIMITGDHPETAFTIGKELGIAHKKDDVINGSDLEKIYDNKIEFNETVNNKTVFARVTPLQKLHIVEALHDAGNFIAVTGDGVNDAPALKKANISVAMGAGTDVAKDVSSMIITDNNFASIVSGIEEGRFAYDNIRKVTYLLVSTGAAEIVLFLLALLTGMPLPLTAVQLLWLNLVTNGIQGVALAFEKGEPNAMKRPPRPPSEGIFNTLMNQELFVSSVIIGFVSFLTWFVLIESGASEYSARNIVLMLIVLFENFHVLNCRSEYKSAFKIPLNNNKLLVFGVLSAQLLHIVALHIPLMQSVLKVEPIEFKEWLYLFGLSVLILVVMEIFKAVKFGKSAYILENNTEN